MSDPTPRFQDFTVRERMIMRLGLYLLAKDARESARRLAQIPPHDSRAPNAIIEMSKFYTDAQEAEELMAELRSVATMALG
jgi:hypothetical protein